MVTSDSVTRWIPRKRRRHSSAALTVTYASRVSHRCVSGSVC